MGIAKKVKNVVRGLKQRWGTPRMKRTLWNKEFGTGYWSNLENTKNDVIYQYLLKYCNNGKVLDLGCGSGNTGCELAAQAYRSYTGIDISDVAIENARQRCRVIGRDGKNQYHQADIMTYVPDSTYDVILFRESIPYIPKLAIKSQLARYANCLKDEGVFIIRWYHHVQAQKLLSNVLTNYDVVEQHTRAVGKPFIVVMKPRKSRSRK